MDEKMNIYMNERNSTSFGGNFFADPNETTQERKKRKEQIAQVMRPVLDKIQTSYEPVLKLPQLILADHKRTITRFQETFSQRMLAIKPVLDQFKTIADSLSITVPRLEIQKFINHKSLQESVFENISSGYIPSIIPIERSHTVVNNNYHIYPANHPEDEIKINRYITLNNTDRDIYVKPLGGLSFKKPLEPEVLWLLNALYNASDRNINKTFVENHNKKWHTMRSKYKKLNETARCELIILGPVPNSLHLNIEAIPDMSYKSEE